MRAPFQEGEFPGPVKYGYLNVGAVEEGPAELRGRTVFCLYPHQTRTSCPPTAVSVVPGRRPAARAVLAGTRRDGRQRAVGRRTARRGPRRGRRRGDGGLLRRPAAAALSGRARHARRRRSRPLRRLLRLSASTSRCRTTRPASCDLVVHTSATSAGLQRSLELLAAEGIVVDLSWYGETEVRLSLGGAFHSRRLAIRSSQVGALSPSRAPRRTAADRLALALELLRDPAFDVLLTGESHFDELPDVMARLADGSLPALCHTITYGEG